MKSLSQLTKRLHEMMANKFYPTLVNKWMTNLFLVIWRIWFLGFLCSPEQTAKLWSHLQLKNALDCFFFRLSDVSHKKRFSIAFHVNISAKISSVSKRNISFIYEFYPPGGGRLEFMIFNGKNCNGLCLASEKSRPSFYLGVIFETEEKNSWVQYREFQEILSQLERLLFDRSFRWLRARRVTFV